MRQLTEEEKEKLWERINEFKEKSERKLSWFGYNVEDQLDLTAVFYSEEHDSELEVFIEELNKSDLEFEGAVIFPEPKETEFDEWWPGKPLIIEDSSDLDELFDKLEFGFTNYYLINSVNNFSWFINFCHERDVHFSGEEKLVDQFRDKLSDKLAIEVKSAN